MPRLDYFNNSKEAWGEWYRRYRQKNRTRIKQYNQEYSRRKKGKIGLSTEGNTSASILGFITFVGGLVV